MKRLLIDSDIFVVLAASESIDVWLGMLGLSFENACVLPSLQFMLKAGKPMYNKINERIPNHLKKIQDTEKHFQRLPENKNAGDIDMFKCHGIDDGESSLFAHLKQHEADLMITKDCRCLETLSQGKKNIKRHVCGRIYCFEQVLMGLYRAKGFDFMVAQFQPIRACDKGLLPYFSDANCGNEGSFLDCMASIKRKRLASIQGVLSEEWFDC